MKLLLLTLLLTIFTFTATAQDYEYGSASDLKGLSKVFINTGANLKSRERIINELKKQKVEITLVDDADSAEIILRYEADSAIVTKTAVDNGGFITFRNARVSAGTGAVFVEGKSGKPRVVMSFENSRQSKLEKRPEVKFARAFAKAFKEANP